MRHTLMVAAAVSGTAAIYVALAHWGNPQAVWLVCDVLGWGICS